jgi:hypothetical protein
MTASVVREYSEPGVSARPITDGNPDYLAWIAEETDQVKAPTAQHGAKTMSPNSCAV